MEKININTKVSNEIHCDICLRKHLPINTVEGYKFYPIYLNTFNTDCPQHHQQTKIFNSFCFLMGLWNKLSTDFLHTWIFFSKLQQKSQLSYLWNNHYPRRTANHLFNHAAKIWAVFVF